MILRHMPTPSLPSLGCSQFHYQELSSPTTNSEIITTGLVKEPDTRGKGTTLSGDREGKYHRGGRWPPGQGRRRGGLIQTRAEQQRQSKAETAPNARFRQDGVVGGDLVVGTVDAEGGAVPFQAALRHEVDVT